VNPAGYAEQTGIESFSIACNARDALGILQHKSNELDFIVLDLTRIIHGMA